jgi:hypothetical protein
MLQVWRATCTQMLQMPVLSSFGDNTHLPKWTFLIFSMTCQTKNTRQGFIEYLPNLHSPKIPYHATHQTQQHLVNLANVSSNSQQVPFWQVLTLAKFAQFETLSNNSEMTSRSMFHRL